MQNNIADRFEYHKVDGGTQMKMGMIRIRIQDTACLIADILPHSMEAEEAMKKLEEAAMWANKCLCLHQETD